MKAFRTFALLMLLILFLPLPLTAGRLHHESYYQKAFCDRHRGKTEVKLPDGARVDCLTDRYAVEVDFANKVFEGVGQSLYYALKTGKRPGVVVIVERLRHDRKNVKRLMDLAKEYDIAVWSVDSGLLIRKIQQF